MSERRWFGITHALVLLNVAVFLLQVFMWDQAFVEQYVLTKDAIVVQHQYERLFIASVLHADITHLGMNVVFLYFLGRICERAYGHIVTVAIYASGVVVGGLAFIYMFPGQSAVGASAGVFGLAGAAMLGAPEESLFEDIPLLDILALPVLRNFSSAIVISTVFLVLPNLLNTFNLADNVAHISHVGGLAAGALYAFLLKPEHAKKGIVVFLIFSGFIAVLLMDVSQDAQTYAVIGMLAVAVLLRLVLALV